MLGRGVQFECRIVHPTALHSSSPRGLPWSSVGTQSGKSHPAKQQFLQVSGEYPKGYIPAGLRGEVGFRRGAGGTLPLWCD